MHYLPRYAVVPFLTLQNNKTNAMKKFLQLGLICWAFQSTQAQTPSFNKFTTQAGVISVLNDGGYLAAYDSTYTGSILPGQAIKKVNANGSVAWTYLLKSGSNILSAVRINAIADDGNGGAIVGGGFRDVVYFDTDSLKSSLTNKNSALMMRVSATGKTWWFQGEATDGGAYVGDDMILHLTVKNNNIYAAGSIKSRGWKIGSITFPRSTHNTNEKVLVAKLALDGTVTWANLTAKSAAYVNGFDVDANGNAYVLGYLLGSEDLVLSPNITVDNVDFGNCVIKYSDAGVVTMVKIWTYNDGAAVPRAIAVDSAANIYVAGYSGNFGSDYKGFVLRKNISYLLKLKADGAVDWLRVLNASHNASTLSGAMGVGVAGSKAYVMGNFAVKGYLQSNATDSVTIEVRTGLSALAETFIARYTADGTLDWHETGKHDGIITNNQATGMVSTPDKSQLAIVGTFTTSSKFGTLTLPAVGTLGAYLSGFISLNTGNPSSGLLNNNNLHLQTNAYPNPANQKINITIANQVATLSCTLYDLQGREIMSTTTQNSNNVVMDVAQLNNGVYLLKTTANDKVATNRIVITH